MSSNCGINFSILLSSGCGHRGPLKLPDSNASCKEVRDDRFQ